MSFTDSLFRSSFWSYETHEVVLRRLSELHMPRGDLTTANLPERQSRFSVSSDDEEPTGSRPFNAIISQPPQRAPQIAHRNKALPPIPRAYNLARQQGRHTTLMSSGLRDIDGISWPMPPGVKPPPRRPRDPVYIVSKMSRSRVFLFVATICMAQLCAQAGIGQTFAVFREASASFGMRNKSDLIWALAGYSLAIGTFISIAGRLGDIYGCKRVFLAGFIWAAVWSAISGLAVYSTHVLFIISRVFHGLGAALSLPNGIAILGMAYPPGKQKTMVFTLAATMAPIGIVVGAVSGSLFALAWWPWTYWTFALTLLIIAGSGYFTIPRSIQKNKTPPGVRAAISELDIPGAITGVSALVLISFAWNQAPLIGWQEPYIWVALIVGILLAMLFLLIEKYYAPKPLLPFYALSSDMAFILTIGGCGWSCFGIWASYTWQFVENIRGVSPLLAAAYISPCIVVGCLATLSAGFVLQRLGLPLAVFVSLLGFALGSVLVATMPAVQIYWAQLFFSVLAVSWAIDTSFPAIALSLSNSVERKHQGTAASLVSTVMNYSISLGLGIARTAESCVNRSDSSAGSKLKGYRAALFIAVGLAVSGTLICSAFLLKNYWRKPRLCYNCHGVLEGNQI
ncbi:multidrug-resistance type transporter aminotriazole resistance [Parahypoxylon ruwenzoriense]